MGAPMAANLLAGGYSLSVHDTRPASADALLGAGAEWAESVAHACAGADVVLMSLPTPDAVEIVAGEAIGAMQSGAVLVDHSTSPPALMQRLAARASERGIDFLDAPVSGGRAGARRGTLSVIVGGEAKVLERCRPIFETSAAQIIHTGALGSGAATKLCNNLMTYLGFAAAYEANLLAKAAGLSLESLDEVTRSNGNLNGQMSAFLGLHRADTDRSAQEFQQAIRNFANLADKDLAVTLAFARECGVTLPATGLCQQIMPRVYGLIDENRR